MTFESWGRYPKVSQEATLLNWPSDDLKVGGEKKILPFGLGRSYGDSCLNDGGRILVTTNLNRYVKFDRERGTLECEAGVTFEQILKDFVPRGWFLPVSPGTKFVTVGGAIANDIHGKNHHRAGTFGNHVTKLTLKRSDNSEIECSHQVNPDLFYATIGGLGLTGLILKAEFFLKKIQGPYIDQEIIKFHDLIEFFELSEKSEEHYEYCVSWLDCLSGKGARGLFIRGNHSDKEAKKFKTLRNLSLPFDFPSGVVNSLSVRLFNKIYYNKTTKQHSNSLVHYEPFFYPLDRLLHWNRMYGKKGFLQYQCVVPIHSAQTIEGEPISQILDIIRENKAGSFLTVLKTFGDKSSPGLLSFPRKGVTLALDFPMGKKDVFGLFDKIDEIVAAAGGAVYPAKDAHMKEADFKKFYPKWSEFQKYIDPYFSSGFSRRVGLTL